MRTLEKRDIIVVSVVSTCILHDNIAGGNLMFCKLRTLWIVFVWQSPAQPLPRPRPTPNFLSQERIRSPGPSHHLRYLTANSTCPLSLWNRSFQEWVLWRLCLIFIAPIRLFNALLLCSISLNIFMSKKKQQKRSYKYVSYTVTRATQLPSFFFFFSPNDPFQVDNTILIWVRLGVRNVMHVQQIQLQLTWSVS